MDCSADSIYLRWPSSPLSQDNIHKIQLCFISKTILIAKSLKCNVSGFFDIWEIRKLRNEISVNSARGRRRIHCGRPCKPAYHLVAGKQEKTYDPLPPRRGRHALVVKNLAAVLISIHSPMRRETYSGMRHPQPDPISIHSLHAEGDRWRACSSSGQHYFNPLPPCGGRRGRRWSTSESCRNFNPLPPCGGRRQGAHLAFSAAEFQSTPSVWRETSYAKHCSHRGAISIHSLRAEGD